jgi:bacterioferritin
MQSVAGTKRTWTEGGAMTSGCKSNATTVIRLLNDALATEVICILRYKRHYFMAAGIRFCRAKA